MQSGWKIFVGRSKSSLIADRRCQVCTPRIEIDEDRREGSSVGMKQRDSQLLLVRHFK